MRSLLVAFSLAVAVPAVASFELVLVADSTNARIHRIDGETGTYLGSFGSNILVNPQAITIDQSTSTAYVGDIVSGLVAFNYFTGQTLAVNRGLTSFVDLALRADGNLVRSAGGVITNAPFPSGSSTLYNTGGGMTTFEGVGVDSTGDIIANETTTGRLFRWNPAVFSAPEASSAAGTFLGVSGGSARGNLFVALRADGRATNMNTQNFNLSSPSAVANGAWTSAADFAFGHDGFGWGVGIGTGGTRLQRYAEITGAYSPIGSGFAVSQIGTPTSMAVVIAPEPGTMLALGAGAAFLLRTRRRARG